MGERRSLPRVNNVSGKAARREAASLLALADRRMSKLRPGCVSAMPQSMRNQSKRQTHSDRPSEDEAQGVRSVPGVQRRERSTPNARPVSSDGSDQLQPLNGCPTGEGLITPTAGLDRGRRARSTPSVRSALPAKDQRQLRFSSIPSWATGGERIILRSCPCNRDHAPRFLWSETLEKAKQCSHYHPARRLGERACRPPFADRLQSVHKS